MSHSSRIWKNIYPCIDENDKNERTNSTILKKTGDLHDYVVGTSARDRGQRSVIGNILSRVKVKDCLTTQKTPLSYGDGGEKCSANYYKNIFY